MNSELQAKYQEWLESPYFDEKTKEELRSLEGNDKEIEERFYKDLEFGTGGMRGLMGAGTNRLNIYTVRRAANGLAEYIRSVSGEDRGVVLVYDSRHNSKEMAEETALVLNANGIKTWMFDSLRPTPELSFAIRELGAIAGVAITASHNPAEYNGFKVYWEDGGQICPPHDRNIMERASAITSLTDIKTMTRAESEKQGLYQTLGEEMDRKYLDAVRSVLLDPDVLKENAGQIRIVYTPLHGAGNLPIQRLLSSMGFTQVYVVKTQEEPDGNFTTCEKPNPEEESAWTEALKLAKEVDADIVLATDPDSDRIGMYAKDRKTGEYVLFTGNMIGILLCEYVLSKKKQEGTLDENSVVMKTIVSSPMAESITERYGCQLKEVLTGFKYIGEAIHTFEEEGVNKFVFGYEESLGILSDTYVRDKDAQCAVALIAEAAAYYNSRNMTLTEAMEELYQTYGFYQEGLITVKHQGKEGAEHIKEIMNRLRNDPPAEIDCMHVEAVRDYKTGIITERNGNSRSTELPKSNVLYFELENGWACIRPSGTEPKIKVYFGVRENSAERAATRMKSLRSELLKLIS